MADRIGVVETRRAMFWAALVADCAGEPLTRATRVAAALIRAPSVAEFCSRAGIALTPIKAALEDPETVTFNECQRIVMTKLEEAGVELASKEHLAMMQSRLRPLEPLVREVLDPMVAEQGHLALSPLQFLLELMRADSALAERLAPHGMSVEALTAR
jgi:hypothetical protein